MNGPVLGEETGAAYKAAEQAMIRAGFGPVLYNPALPHIAALIAATARQARADERDRIAGVYKRGCLDLAAIYGGPDGVYTPAPEDTW